MAKCIRCDREMESLSVRGQCRHCGLDVEDMAKVLYEAIQALGWAIRELKRVNRAKVNEAQLGDASDFLSRARFEEADG